MKTRYRELDYIVHLEPIAGSPDELQIIITRKPEEARRSFARMIREALAGRKIYTAKQKKP
jgi:hypothetical protein